jgi:DNA-binding CsgD family transcriptional regulator/predicted ester cyclase
MSNHITEELTKNFILPLWNDRKLELIERYVASNTEIHTTFIKGIGPSILRKSVEETFIAFPNFKLTLEEIIQQNEGVTYKWSAVGEHRGNILNIPPTGKMMAFHGIAFGLVKSGMITQYHSFSNISQTLYSHLGTTANKQLFPPETVLLDHENYEKEITDIIFTLVKSANVRLTRREVECLYFWLKGYSIKETARQLGDLSSKTIQVFRDKIRKKFEVTSYRNLVDLLQKKGLLVLFLPS